MKYSLSFLENDFEILTGHLFSDSSVEQAAFLLCNFVATGNETRFLVKSVILVSSEDLCYQTESEICIPSKVFMPVLKKAFLNEQCFFLVHSHPQGMRFFSGQDDFTEPDLFTTAYNRIRGGVHGSLVFTNPDDGIGRVWIKDGSNLKAEPLYRICSIGKRYLFLDYDNLSCKGNMQVFDRNILAFGIEMQNLLGRLHIGVVGCGGTGSAVVEQLVRLGVGEIIVYDDDVIDSSNLTRIHGSGRRIVGLPKVILMKQIAEEVGLGTKLVPINDSIKIQSIAKTLRQCDIIFGCTDDNFGRAVLNQIALRYYIPCIDMGVIIDSEEQQIKKIISRITFVQPGGACLLCRGRIDTAKMAIEMKPKQEVEALVAEGYAPELDVRDPAVISYTTHVASLAVSELLNKLIGLVNESETSELLYIFNERRLLRTTRSPSSECYCGDYDVIGHGDKSELFLDMTWPKDEE